MFELGEYLNVTDNVTNNTSEMSHHTPKMQKKLIKPTFNFEGNLIEL